MSPDADRPDEIGIGETDYEGPVVDHKPDGPPFVFRADDGREWRSDGHYPRQNMPPAQMSPAQLANGGVEVYQRWAADIAQRAGQIKGRPESLEAWRNAAGARSHELEDVKRELEATQRAKRENDERFQIEAATQRERADALARDIGLLRAELVSARQQAQAFMRARQLRDQEIIDFRAEAREQRARAEHLIVQRDALRTALEKLREQLRKIRENQQAADREPR